VKGDQREIDQVRICRKAGYYVVEIVYTQPDINCVPTPWAVAADLNVDNLAVLSSNQPGFVPLLVNGRPLKAINQRYNQQLADLQARLPGGQYTSKRIRALTDQRNRRLDYHLHLASRRIIEVLEQRHIGT